MRKLISQSIFEKVTLHAAVKYFVNLFSNYFFAKFHLYFINLLHLSYSLKFSNLEKAYSYPVHLSTDICFDCELQVGQLLFVYFELRT